MGWTLAGGVREGAERQREIAVVEAGEGVAEIDRNAGGQAGREAENPPFAVLTELPQGREQSPDVRGRRCLRSLPMAESEDLARVLGSLVVPATGTLAGRGAPVHRTGAWRDRPPCGGSGPGYFSGCS